MNKEAFLYFGGYRGIRLYSRGFRDGVNLAGFGSPGTGKTAALIIPNLVRWFSDGTAFVVDISGDIRNNTPDINRVSYAPWDEENKVLWDVLAVVDKAPAEEKEKLLEKLAFAMIKKEDKKSDAGIHYQTESRDLLKALLCAYYLLGLDFVPICKRIYYSGISELTSICLESKSLTAQAIAKGMADTHGMQDKLREVQKMLAVFAEDGPVPRSLQRGGISPELIEDKSIYFLIPDTELLAAGQLLQVVAAQVWGYLAARPLEKTNKVLLCLDEFASLGSLPITDALQKFRKRHVSVMYFMQSISSLDRLYDKESRRELIGATRYMVVLDSTDTEDQAMFSKKAGEYVIKTKSETRNHNADEGEDKERWSETQTERRESRIAPDEFASLPDMKKFALFHPGGVALVRPVFYYKDRKHKRLCKAMRDKELERRRKALIVWEKEKLRFMKEEKEAAAAVAAAKSESLDNACCYAAALEMGVKPWTPKE